MTGLQRRVHPATTRTRTCAQSQGHTLRSPWSQNAERPGPGINRRPIGCRVTSAAQPIAGLPAQSGSSNCTKSGQSMGYQTGQVYLLLTLSTGSARVRCCPGEAPAGYALSFKRCCLCSRSGGGLAQDKGRQQFRSNAGGAFGIFVTQG